MKSVNLSPINRKPQIATNQLLLDALVAEKLDVMMVCGGKGRCATCHVFIENGAESLSPISDRERKTLGRISGSGATSRLACQARVIGDGVKVRLPQGMYVSKASDLESLIGKRAEENILHPIDGRILAATGKIILRSLIMQLKDLQTEIDKLKAADL